MRRRRKEKKGRGFPLILHLLLLYIEVASFMIMEKEPLTVEKVKTFKVEELKSALKARQLPLTGKKNELIDRLIEALTNEATSSNTADDNSSKKDDPSPEETAEEVRETPNETVVCKALFSSETTTAANEEESIILTTETTTGAKEEESTVPAIESSSSSSSSSKNTTINASQSVIDIQATVMTSESESNQDNVVSAVALEPDAVPLASEIHGTDDAKVFYHVRIDNFQRPLTDKALYTWMTEKLGHPVDNTQLWINKIKTHCYMDFPTREAAQACIDAVTGCKVDSKHSMVLEADFTDISVAGAEESGEAKCKPGEWKAFRDAAKLAAIHGKGHKVSGGNSSSSSGGNDGGHDMMKKGTAGTGLARQLLGTTGALRRGREEGNVDDETTNEERGNGNKKAKVEMVNEMEDNNESALALDSLFRKTNTQPSLYWLPVSDEEIQKRMAKKEQNN